MRIFTLALAMAFALLMSTPARAGDGHLVVVELYTSQGCSSCPPVDALLAELTTRDDVLPLALHVDYWDYIGWADTFGRPAHTARQKAYVRVAGGGHVYTPQMVVGGVEHLVGYKPMKLADLLVKHRAAMGEVELSAVAEGNMLRITAGPRDGAVLPDRIMIDIVGYTPEAKVAISHGENAGQTITYANIVTSWEHAGRWNGQGRVELSAPMPDAPRAAVIVQVEGPRRVLAAAKVR